MNKIINIVAPAIRFVTTPLAAYGGQVAVANLASRATSNPIVNRVAPYAGLAVGSATGLLAGEYVEDQLVTRFGGNGVIEAPELVARPVNGTVEIANA